MPILEGFMDFNEIARIRKEYAEILDKRFPTAKVLDRYQDKQKNEAFNSENLSVSQILYTAYAPQYDANGKPVKNSAETGNRKQAYIDTASNFEAEMEARLRAGNKNKTNDEQILEIAISMFGALNTLETHQRKIESMSEDDWMDVSPIFLDALKQYQEKIKLICEEHNKLFPEKSLQLKDFSILEELQKPIEKTQEFRNQDTTKKQPTVDRIDKIIAMLQSFKQWFLEKKEPTQSSQKEQSGPVNKIIDMLEHLVRSLLKTNKIALPKEQNKSQVERLSSENQSKEKSLTMLRDAQQHSTVKEKTSPKNSASPPKKDR